MSTEPRRAGRPARNGSTPPKEAEPAAPVTATETLARLQALRDSGGGFLIPAPPGIAAARLVEPPDNKLGDRLGIPNAAMQSARAWLEQIAEVGSPEDLRLAWEMWRIPSGTSPTVNAKLSLLSHYEALMVECGRRWSALYRQAEREQHNERVVASLRSDYHRAKAEADKVHRDYLVACDKARKIEVQIEALQRRARGELVH